MKQGKNPLPTYPPEHLQAYLTLGIRLGAADMDEKMEALKYLCAYYHKKKLELKKQ
jgi:hypothetical protein